jgi:hypothetical protein
MNRAVGRKAGKMAEHRGQEIGELGAGHFARSHGEFTVRFQTSA